MPKCLASSVAVNGSADDAGMEHAARSVANKMNFMGERRIIIRGGETQEVA